MLWVLIISMYFFNVFIYIVSSHLVLAQVPVVASDALWRELSGFGEPLLLALNLLAKKIEKKYGCIETYIYNYICNFYIHKNPIFME